MKKQKEEEKSELRKQVLFLKITQSWMTNKTLKYDKYCKMGVMFFVYLLYENTNK